jgi:hypothetical protein
MGEKEGVSFTRKYVRQYNGVVLLYDKWKVCDVRSMAAFNILTAHL